jgi:hypothetical protein
MSLTLSAAARTVMVDALRVLIDAGSGAGTLQIRSGTRPAGPGTTATGTLLATITLTDPAFGAGSSGVSTMGDPAGVTAAADGTASWFRILDSNSVAVIDGKVTATGGGGDLTLGTVSLTTGLTIDVTGGTLTQPAGTAD